MKKIYIAFMAFAALAAVSCNTKEEYGSLPSGEVMFTAIQADNPESKTILQSDGSVFWSAGDSINLFFGTAGSAKLISNNSEPVQQTTFSGSLGGYTHNGSNYFYAVYPYSAENTFDGTAFTVTLPEVQSSVAGSFADDLFISMARSQDYTLQFYNLCGGVKFSVAEAGIKYVTFRGNNNEPLAGKVNVIFNDDGKPVVQTVVDGKAELRLDAPDGGSFEPGEWYYMVSLPATLSAGYTMAFYKDEKFAERITDSAITIKRAVWGRLTDADDIPADTQPNNEIWYTSTDGKIVVPKKTNMFGASLLSNTYENGKGIMTFDGPVTMVGNSSYYISTDAQFSNCYNLLSISLPESVETIGYAAFERCRSLQIVKMPSHLAYLSGGVFEETAISSIYIPETDVFKGMNPVSYCSNLAEITGPYASSDGRCLIIGSTILAFASAGLDSYTIEEGITEIGNQAFTGSLGLRSITFSSSLKRILNQSFGGCSLLENVILPEGIESVGFAAFTGCASLTTITLPSSLSNLDDRVFDNCTSLRSFTGKYASSDERLLIDKGKVKAFAQSGLTEYTIPEGITSVTDGFDGSNNLPSLESLTLPSTLRSLALRGQAITTLTSLATTPPSVSSSYYLYLPKVETIYVPEGSVEAYKEATYWCEYADRIQAIQDNTIPEAVDLGLPSGLKWASFNVGANAPEEYGDYFAWGETEPYYSSQDPLTWKNGKEAGYNWTSYKFELGTGSLGPFSKYVTENSENIGNVDNNTELDPEDDAAAVNWGGTWRMPTDAEWTELRTECTWTWTMQNGVNGRLVTGPSGNSIFLPAAGFRYNTDLGNAGSGGYYWSSSLYADYPYHAWRVGFLSGGARRNRDERYSGLSVRPVTDEGVRVSVTGVSLNESSLNLLEGGTASLTATVTPSNATQPNVIWSSSDNTVATVDYTGKVTAIATGTAIITAKTYDGGFTATCQVTVTAAPEAVDLGLTSGLKWASCNVGATAPWEYGDYFAWGDPEPYYTAGHSQDDYCENWRDNKTGYNWASYKFELGNDYNGPFSKYVTNSSYGTVDNNTELDPEDDAASVNWGGSWRMPTDAEWTELRTECTWAWTTLNGVNGRLVTGHNGNRIFLPAVGYRGGTYLNDAGSYGRYWSSSLYMGNPDYAWYVYFDSDGVYRSSDRRYYGLSVRPVTE